MFRFANPEYLYLLLLLPVVWVLYFYGVWRNRRNMARMGRADVLGGLMQLCGGIAIERNLLAGCNC